jgi:heat shock protein HslJ
MKRLPAITLLAVALTACGGLASSAAPSQGLEGTSWALVEINGREPEGEIVPTLAFDAAGNINGSAGCNTYTGAATIEGDSISFGPLATTRMACTGAAGIAETAFLTAMQTVEAYAIDSQGRLVLEDGVVLVFEPA